MKRWGLLFAGCAAMLWTAGCSDSEPAEPEADGQVEIVLSADFSGAVSGEVASQNVRPGTRAVYNPVHAALDMNFARIDMDAAGAYPTDGYATSARLLNATLAECTANQGTDEDPDYFTPITFDPKEYYSVGRDNTKNKSRLIGWYPRATPAAGVVTIAVDGETDVMVSNEVEGNKVAPCGKVSFQHVLTQLKVNAYALDEAAKTKWGAIESIGLKTADDGSQGKFHENCVITLPTAVTTGTPATATVTKDSETTTGPALAMKNIADDTDLHTTDDTAAGGLVLPLATLDADKNVEKTNARPCGYAMFTPFAANEQITLEIVTTNGGTQHVLVDWKNGYEAGKAYTLTLRFTVSDIALKGEITAWSEYEWPEEGDFKGDIEI